MNTKSCTLFITTPFVSWLTLQAREVATKHQLALEEYVIKDTELARNYIKKRIHRGDIEALVFITVHSVRAFGGACYVEELATIVPVIVWNVDCVPIIYRCLPKAQNIKYLHASPDDARFWQKHFSAGAHSDCTYGVGTHIPRSDFQFEAVKKEIDLLAPINLRWCGRTLDEIHQEITAQSDRIQIKYEAYFEELRLRPEANIPEVVFADGELNFDEKLKLARYVIYGAQLWRRERLVEALLDFPVLIDTNFLPEYLKNKAALGKATLLKQSSIPESDERTRRAKCVLSCSSSHDLYHDRVSTALSVGCLASTEKNGIYPKIHAEHLHYYNFKDKRCNFDFLYEEILNNEQACLERLELTRAEFNDFLPSMGFDKMFHESACKALNKIHKNACFESDRSWASFAV